MEVIIDQQVLQKERVTYQEEIPLTVKCQKCKSLAKLMMQVHDSGHEVVEQRPKKVRVWPHDSSVVNIYLCTDCGEITATWNQA